MIYAPSRENNVGGKILAVLHNVPNNAKIIKVASSTFGAEGFLESDLDIVDKLAIPDLVEKHISESDHHDVFDHLFSEIVINAVNLIIF